MVVVVVVVVEKVVVVVVVVMVVVAVAVVVVVVVVCVWGGIDHLEASLHQVGECDKLAALVSQLLDRLSERRWQDPFPRRIVQVGCYRGARHLHTPRIPG
jgi:predicted PurR-regulated permease PerM